MLLGYNWATDLGYLRERESGREGVTDCLFRDGWSSCCKVWQTPSRPPPSHLASLVSVSRAWDSAVRPSRRPWALLTESSGGGASLPLESTSSSSMQVGEEEKGGGEAEGDTSEGSSFLPLFFNIYFLFTWLC